MLADEQHDEMAGAVQWGGRGMIHEGGACGREAESCVGAARSGWREREAVAEGPTRRQARVKPVWLGGDCEGVDWVGRVG